MSTARFRPALLPWSGRVIILQQDPGGIACRVIILIRPERPNKSKQRPKTKDQRTGHKDHKYVHGIAFVLRAFRVTVIELLDIARAAISGVANPASASGIATML